MVFHSYVSLPEGIRDFEFITLNWDQLRVSVTCIPCMRESAHHGINPTCMEDAWRHCCRRATPEARRPWWSTANIAAPDSDASSKWLEGAMKVCGRCEKTLRSNAKLTSFWRWPCFTCRSWPLARPKQYQELKPSEMLHCQKGIGMKKCSKQ